MLSPGYQAEFDLFVSRTVHDRSITAVAFSLASTLLATASDPKSAGIGPTTSGVVRRLGDGGHVNRRG
jgi:hypothetical protein